MVEDKVMAVLTRWSVILFLGLHVAHGSVIDFSTWPTEIKDGLSGSLAFHCSLNDTAPSAGGIVGRRDITMTTDNVDEVTSVIIMHNGQDIAAVSHKHPAAMLDGSSAHVQGNVDGAAAVRGSLEVSMVNPGPNDTGEFVCEINAVTKTGHTVQFTRSLEVSIVTPTIADLVQYIRNQQNTIHGMMTTINNLTSTVDDLHQKNQQLENTVNELKHVETGTIDCGNSLTWVAMPSMSDWKQSQHSLSFKQPYSRTPVVSLSVNQVDQAEHEHLWYVVEVVSVDGAGFSMRCRSPVNTAYHVWHFTVKWTSIGH